MGSLDYPFNPVSLALGAEATFVARTMDSDRAHLTSVLRAAAEHDGTALVEIYQNCPIFNDGVFDGLKDGEEKEQHIIRLEHGEPIVFGAERENGVIRAADGSIQTAKVADVGLDSVLVHDAHANDPGLAFALSRLSNPENLDQTPMGIFRSVERPTYDTLLRDQVAQAQSSGAPDLAALIAGNDTWTIS